ncbi:MAG TPA: hypothetical protein VFZ61_04500 [Polyangiales bacterium]
MRAASLTVFAISLLGATRVALTPSRASACGGTLCRAAGVLPLPGPVPVDQLRWTFTPPSSEALRGDGAVGHPELYRVRGTERENIPLRVEYSQAALAYRLTPQAVLQPGERLVLTAEGSHCDKDAGLEAAFEITAKAALPASLGTLELESARASIQVATWAGSCSLLVDAFYVDLRLTASPGASELENVIDYQLMLDGRPYEFYASLAGGKAGLARWQERVYLPCTPVAQQIASTPTGRHTAFMRGVLPNGEHIETPEVSFELRCPEAAPADAGAGDAESDADAPLDAGTSAADELLTEAGHELADPHTSRLDAGAPAAAAARASADEPVAETEASGCSARAHTTAEAPWWASSLLAAVGWVAARRRARR